MKNWSGIEEKKDNLAFLFNLQNKKIYTIKKGENAIDCNVRWLTNFYNSKGSCSSLKIQNNFFSNVSNTCKLKDTAFEGFVRDYELNNGSQYFTVSNLEVFEINYF